MLFSRNKENPYQIFYRLIEENIDLFSEAIKEHTASGTDLSDEEFTACYTDGMQRVINKLHHWAYADLQKEDGKGLTRYVCAMESPAKYGFRFPNDEMTIGKIYLYYNYGKTGRKAHKSDCIKLERYAFSLIGKQCLDHGLVH